MHIVLNITTGGDHMRLKNIRVSDRMKESKMKKYFKRHEGRMNNLLQSFLMYGYQTKITTVEKILQRLYDSLKVVFKDFTLITFKFKMDDLKKMKNSNETDILEIEEKIENFIEYIFTHLVGMKTPSIELPYQQKTNNFINKQNRKGSYLFNQNEEQGSSLAKLEFSKHFKREINVFQKTIQVEGNINKKI